MIHRSPFSDNRFEHELKHLYVVKLPFYSKLEEGKSVVLVGTRGTGKTTLLQTLSWRERTSNQYLQEQLGAESDREFAGIYIKPSEAHVLGLLPWLRKAADPIKFVLYSRYLELLVIQELLNSVVTLTLNGSVALEATQERKLVDSIVKTYGNQVSISFVGKTPPKTLEELKDEIRQVRKLLEQCAQSDASPLEACDLIGKPTTLLELMLALCDGLASKCVWTESGKQLEFKICLDEVEALQSEGRLVLMTWLRLARKPLSFVLSFVGLPPDWSATLIPNLTIQSADVHRINLDELTDADFEKFAEWIAERRLNEFLSNVRKKKRAAKFPDSDKRFSTEKAFGKLNLNLLLQPILEPSESPLAIKVLAKAKEMSNLGGYRRSRGDDSALPLYQAYLAVLLERREAGAKDVTRLVGFPAPPETSLSPKKQKRREQSQHDRKKMVAAYLSLLKDLGSEVRYASADMVLQMSDVCIRDYLSNLDGIFVASGLACEEFVRQFPIATSIQDRGLKDASLAKRNSLPDRGLARPSEVANLVEGLGNLTRSLQVGLPANVRHLGSSERGLFEMTLDQPTCEPAVELIVDAAQAGYLKIIERNHLMIRFRVHTSLAAYFRFSYRGAYYPTGIGAKDIYLFQQAPDRKAAEDVANAIFRAIEGDSTMRLF